MRYRIGMGHDTHRLEPGGPLILGGLTIPHDRQMVGHSDADALLHAVTDALLGGACLGDIGDMFPNTDPRNKDRDSADLLRIAAAEVFAAGFSIENLDCVIFAEQPKLGGYKRQMADRIAEILQLNVRQVNVKAKTGEQVGPVGRQEAIMAQVVALLGCP